MDDNPLYALLRSNKEAILEGGAVETPPPVQKDLGGATNLLTAYEILRKTNKRAHLLTPKDLQLLEWLASHRTSTRTGALTGAATQKELKEELGMSNNEYCSFVRDRLCKKLGMVRTFRDPDGVGRPKVVVELADDAKRAFA